MRNWFQNLLLKFNLYRYIAARHGDRLNKLVILNGVHPSVFLKFVLSNPVQLLKSYYIGFFQLPVIPEAIIAAGVELALFTTLLSSQNTNMSSKTCILSSTDGDSICSDIDDSQYGTCNQYNTRE